MIGILFSLFLLSILHSAYSESGVENCQVDGYCSQICNNINGTAECSCLKGYQLQNRTCVAKGGGPKIIILAESELLVFGKGEEISIPIDTGPYDKSLAYYHDHKSIYWSDGKELTTLHLVDSRSGMPRMNFSIGHHKHIDLAADWKGVKLYLADRDLRKIFVCSPSGYYCVVVNYNVSATSLALDPRNGTMYWSSMGENAAIYRQWMDGRNTQPFVSGLNNPDALVLDPVLERLYWTHLKDVRCIEKINLDGTGRKVILQDSRYSPHSLAVFEDTLYWSDDLNATIYTCNKFTGEDVSVLFRRAGKIIVTHDVIAESYDLEDPCRFSSCDHLCVIHPEGYSCACAEGYRLENESCSIQSMTPRLFVSEGDDLIYDIPYNVNHMSFILAPYLDSGISDVAYDWEKETILIARIFQGITAVYKNRTSKNIVEGGVGKIFSLSYDHVGENLYWLDNELSTIEVATHVGSFRKVILRIKAFDLALHPEEGIMYVVVQLHPSYITIYNMDGTGRGRLEGTDHTSHIAFNSFSGDLYWFNRKNNSIMQYNAIRKTRVLVLETAREVASFAITEEYVYWMEEGRTGTKYSLLSNTNVSVNIPPVRLYDVIFRHLSYIHPVPSKKVCANSSCSQLCLVVPGGYRCSCSDGYTLDHDNYTCIAKICQHDDFKCGNGECIAFSKRCNYVFDCTDGSDEKNCNLTFSCNINQFSCDDGSCIPKLFRCDGRDDCGDMSDERNCNKSVVPACLEPSFLCKSLDCLPLSLVCDSRESCPSGEDELNCENHTCPFNYTRCNSGQCILKELWCDGVKHCADESDERNCTTATVPGTCEGKFVCKSGLCINISSVCDKKYDCPGKEDELYCESGNCTVGEIECKNGQCIQKDDICDGEKDCPDGEDEANCASRPCNSDELRCLSGMCILKELRCDGYPDCDDGSDEYLCPHNTTTTLAPTCAEGEFHCSSGECVDEAKVCDGRIDCIDTSDEGVNCSFHCNLNNGGCTQLCKSTPHGPSCSCHKGYFLDKDGSSCLDVNECLDSDGNCSHYCHNTKGSYFCSCADGYYLNADGKMCQPYGKETWVLSFVHRKWRFAQHQGLFFTIGREKSVKGLDVDVRGNKVIWTNYEKDAVMYASLNSNEAKVQVITRGIVRPQTIAYDWVAHNYYISSSKGIHACGNSSGVMLCVTLTNSTVNVTSMVVVSDKGLLFCTISSIRSISTYIHKGDSGVGKIVRMDMDGSAISTLLKDGLHYPTDIVIDHVLETVYWGDPIRRVIESMGFDGKNRKTVIRKNVIHPRSISIFSEKLYWIDWESGNGMMCRKRDCENTQVKLGLGARKGIVKWINPVFQPSAENPCAGKGCSDLCLLSRSGATCMCRDGYLATTDGCRNGVCSADYCLNSGICDEGEYGIRCRCSDGYDGERCELRSSSGTKKGVIVGLVIAIVIAISLVVGFILWKSRSVVGRTIGAFSFRDLKTGEDKDAIVPRSEYHNAYYGFSDEDAN